MLIRDVMTRTPVCCNPTDKLDAVARQMLDHSCGEIPVCQGEKVIGVITDRDITCRVVAAGKSPMAVPASDIMTRNVCVIRDSEKLDAALQLMEEELVRRLPVVDGTGKIVGIVSQADLIARVPSLKVARLMRSVSKKTRKEGTVIL